MWPNVAHTPRLRREVDISLPASATRGRDPAGFSDRYFRLLRTRTAATRAGGQLGDHVTGRVKVSDGLSPKALRRLQDTGGLPAEVSVDQLATGLLAVLQGGYMLAQTERDVAPMATSIDMALAHIESLSTVRAKALGRRSLT
jgi:hypothetical protein